jgi:hypothetical protein
MNAIEAEFKSVRDDFIVTDCKKCRTRKLAHTWSRLDFVSMAKTTAELGKLIVPAYLEPTQLAHSTFHSVIVRITWSEADGLLFQSVAQHDDADNALITAHTILLNVIELQRSYFKIPIDVQLQKCFADFADVWRQSSSGDSDPRE